MTQGCVCCAELIFISTSLIYVDDRAMPGVPNKVAAEGVKRGRRWCRWAVYGCLTPHEKLIYWESVAVGDI